MVRLFPRFAGAFEVTAVKGRRKNRNRAAARAIFFINPLIVPKKHLLYKRGTFAHTLGWKFKRGTFA
jgi:hypothetical protein